MVPTPLQTKVKELIREKRTNKQIVKVLKCHVSTVQKIRAGKRGSSNKKRGPHSKKTPKISQALRRQALSRKHYSLQEMELNLKKQGISLSPPTIKKYLQEDGFMEYSPQQHQFIPKMATEKRKQFCRNHLNDDMDEIIWTDETSIAIEPNPYLNPKRKVFAKDRSKVPIRTHAEHPKRLQIWSAISKKRTFPLVFLPAPLNQQEYLSIIQKHILPATGLVLQQDNHRAHKAKGVIRFFDENEVNWIQDWPPYSPDFNPVEDMWHLLRKEFQTHRIRSVRCAKKKLSEIWKSEKMREAIVNTIDDERRKLKSSLKNNGSNTSF